MASKRPVVCGECSAPIVLPIAPDRARFAVVGDKPHSDDYKRRLAWSVIPADNLRWRQTTENDILYTELQRAGLWTGDFVMTNVWQHEPSEDEREYNWHLKQCIQHIKHAQLVLLVGSAATQAFCGANAGDISGLWNKSSLLSSARLMAAPHPRGLLRGTVGEFRLALERFSKEAKKCPPVNQSRRQR